LSKRYNPHIEGFLGIALVTFGEAVSGKILTSARINDYNSYENPHTVSIKDFNGAVKFALKSLLSQKNSLFLQP
jgi:hypothetical protein